MFASFSNAFRLPRLPWDLERRAISLPAVTVHDVETSSDRRARALKHLLKVNHAMHSIIYHELRFHNHVPHVLGTAYILGANEDQLNAIYESESKKLESWADAPGEISKEDWREYLGKREYQRAFVDFFEDQLVAFGYDWKALLDHYLYTGEEPLFSALIGGLGHPLIHLGYAYELDSQTVAIEALAMTACFYDDLHKYTDDPVYTRPSSYTSHSTAEILQRVAADKRFDGIFEEPGLQDTRLQDFGPLIKQREEALLDHWNAWEIDDPTKAFEESQKAAVLAVVGTHAASKQYDFFLLHALTTSHAVRILLPLVPASKQMALVRQWFLFAIMAYIGQHRPTLHPERITDYDLKGRGWQNVTDTALRGQFAHDAHFVKGLRAMKSASETWATDEEFYLKAAVKLADEFNDWGGFSTK